MKNLLKTMKIQGTSMIDRLFLWVGYNIGCWRSISRQFEVIKDYTEQDLEREIEALRDVCNETGLDADYLQKIVRVRLSAAILKYLEISGMKREDRTITSSTEELRKLVENWGQISIEETESGYKYNGKSGLFWATECDRNNKMRFQLFAIIQIRNQENMA